MSSVGRESQGLGQVLNLMSNDVDKLLDWCWTAPLGLWSVLQYVGESLSLGDPLFTSP